MEKKNLVERIKESKIVLRSLAALLVASAIGAFYLWSTHTTSKGGYTVWESLQLQAKYDKKHDHQPIKIERTFCDYDKDGKYDDGITKITYKDGCIDEEKLPWYATGRTREDYEKIYRRIDNIGSVEEIVETLSFE